MRDQVTIGGIAFNLKLVLIIVYSTVVPMIDYYGHEITQTKAYDRLIFYFIIPMVLILLLLRDRPVDYGFGLGNWRRGLLWTVVGCLVMSLILWFVARTPAMTRYYQGDLAQGVGYMIYTSGIDRFAWEFVWRGFVLFGLAQLLGPGPAILFQAVPFAFMHLGKPEIETVTAVFGGIAFGVIAWQSNSFVYPWLIHWYITIFTTLIAAGRLA
jgi:uncharacterized protein